MTNVSIEECQAKHGLLFKIVLGAAGLLLAIGAFLFSQVSEASAVSAVTREKTTYNERSIIDLKVDVKDIKAQQRAMSEKVSEILGIVRANRHKKDDN